MVNLLIVLNQFLNAVEIEAVAAYIAANPGELYVRATNGEDTYDAVVASDPKYLHCYLEVPTDASYSLSWHTTGPDYIFAERPFRPDTIEVQTTPTGQGVLPCPDGTERSIIQTLTSHQKAFFGVNHPDNIIFPFGKGADAARIRNTYDLNA